METLFEDRPKKFYKQLLLNAKKHRQTYKKCYDDEMHRIERLYKKDSDTFKVIKKKITIKFI